MNDKTFPRYMMATTAIHPAVGDISREEDDYCYIKEKNPDGYLGQWVEGYGFINVTFPIETTRELTAEEQEYVDTHNVVVL